VTTVSMVISAQDPTSAILGVGLMLVVGVIIISFLGRANSCTVAAFAALIARLASGLIPYYLEGLTSDQVAYDRQALAIANTPVGSNSTSDLYTGKEAWTIIPVAAYRVIGHAPEFGIGRILAVVATSVRVVDFGVHAAWLMRSRIFSLGFLNPSVLRGRSLSSSATASRYSAG